MLRALKDERLAEISAKRKGLEGMWEMERFKNI